jgi:hypothetical protein
MKKVLFIFTIAAIMSALMVACKNKTTTGSIPMQDTTGFAQFQEWKYQNERLEANQAYTQNTKVPVTRTSKSSTKSGSMTSTSQNDAKVVKKQGWSKAAKGAVIGGGTGAVLGVVLNKKNRVAGGIIGGILGGGLGYGIGRHQDKKDGRY